MINTVMADIIIADWEESILKSNMDVITAYAHMHTHTQSKSL